MTEQDYLKLRAEGQALLIHILNDMNKLMPFSFKDVSEGCPDYRTYESWSEICVALALIERKRNGR